MKRVVIIFCLLILIKPVWSQVVYESLNNDVYEYLERLSLKGTIEINDLVKPLSRKYISEKLLEAKSKIELLTDLDKDELEYYLKDYFLEIEAFAEENKNEKYLSYFERDASGRYRMFSYADNRFKINASPILGYGLKFPENYRNVHSWMGISSYSYLLNSIGLSFNFVSNNENGTGLDIDREFTKETGIIPEVHDNGRDIGYTEITSSISVDWGWGSVAIAKDFLQYGYEKMGNLVLSTKAPSFPFIRLELKPVDWFNFQYFHAWLSSKVIDSTNLAAYKRNIYINKYFAWHALIVTPFKGLDISVGESVVYSGDIEPLYLMPIMFYYAADDYLTNRRGKPGDANQQIFLSLSSKDHIANTHMYGTLFVDELTIGGLNGTLFINDTYGGVTSRRLRTQVGFTLGLTTTDLPINNLTFSTEYTRINPYVYGHHAPAQTYTSSGYLMGHWMGHNSDLLYLGLKYRFFRGFNANVWGAFIRKGSSDYSGQYVQPQEEFLFGLRNNYSIYGLDLKYEVLHEFNVEAKIKLSEISNQQTDDSFINTSVKEFAFSIYYGL